MTDAAGGYPPGAGPAGRVPAEDELLRIVAGQRLGVLAVIKSDGRPHLSNVACAGDPAERVARVSTVAGRAKVRLLRNDPRCSLHIGETVLRYAVAEAEAELSPVSEASGDATGLELLRMSPEHPRVPLGLPRPDGRGPPYGAPAARRAAVRPVRRSPLTVRPPPRHVPDRPRTSAAPGLTAYRPGS
ncbi:pyridoxamine 5'-phosphate oxidase family protein [Streptomyces sp. IBSBF 2435]|uniref:pyridoxamine 5'-phosphate oxidase family protein n=1 Tax=Streptomyces sp. IBSBF 2435 TaxID=2903531 RepID=UPI002FDC3D62